MRLINTGIDINYNPVLKYGEFFFVDMWGHYAHYADASLISFTNRLSRFVEYRQSTTNYFCDNYIKRYIAYVNNSATQECS